jgi:Alpha amylase inhibitor
MRMRTPVAVIAGTLAVALAPAPALAEASPALAEGSPAPSCVTFKSNFWLGRIEVHNGCASSQRVKIVIQNYVDSECKTLSPGEHWNKYSPFIHVDRLERC